MFNIGVIGIGFLGGSLVKSLSKSDKVNEIIALDKNVDSLKKAYEDKVITEYTTEVDESFKKCDIVFICTPVSFVIDYAKELKKYVKTECIITDTRSTKKTILEKTSKLDIEFIGGHPMVGSERIGYETSQELLFENSKKYRDSFINRKINGNTMPELNICIKDENGSIAKITNILAKNNVGIKNIEILNNRENNFGALRVVIKTYEERDRAYEAIKRQGYDLIKIN